MLCKYLFHEANKSGRYLLTNFTRALKTLLESQKCIA